MQQSQGLLSERQVREQIIALADKARKRFPAQTGPETAKRLGLAVVDGKLPPDQDGAYIEDEKKIVINSIIASKERRDFTCFHEIVHHLLRDDDDIYSYLHDAYPDSQVFEKTIERLCNVGAAEYLLPRASVRKMINANGFSLSLVPTLCADHGASGPAALIQLIQNAPNRCYGVICEFGFPPSRQAKDQKTFVGSKKTQTLYIMYAMWSHSARYTIARYTPIPSGHILMKAYKERSAYSGEERIPFRSGKGWPVQCEAMSFRSSAYGLFHVEPPPNKLQLELPF